MAKVEQLVNASPERVFAVLADGWTYSDWVVGTAHIRAVDASWPKVGARLFHKAGPWPISIRDMSTVIESEPPRLLVVKLRLWPLGAGVSRFELEQVGERTTRVTLYEEFTEGPLKAIQTKINDMVLHVRNKETLRRLADLATRRSPRPSDAESAGLDQAR
jgi:uncharacterized protein YndB with AHSA1/START domain